ncbi:restriction endonuclease subunit S [Bacillus altitudinis]|uniref:restriction endonuclease subunit S n=1 Tax=Bacillus TaxID=1386 RepID=UPI0022821770|nr:restriction endonuclease subunit S [Bacillus altitudinis]MCY7716603.1 restriction endonuclease subunit S [Bacillus altitudinis]
MSKKKKTIEELLKEALVSDEQQPYEVPENWVWTKLGCVFEQVKEQIQPTGNEKYIGLEHMNKGGGILEVGNTEGVKSKKVVFKKNDVLYGKLRPYLNKHAYVEFDGVASTDILVYRNKNIRANKLLNMYLGLPQVLQYANENSNGINLPRVSPKAMDNMFFPLPPFHEQKRIADKVERLISKIDEAKQLVEEAKKTFELRRAAILDKAFRGELTRKWRGENADITTANEWIEQINLLKEGTKTKYKDQLDSSILEKLYELPREWKWVRLNDLIEASTYGTSAKTNDDVTGTPVLRMGNIVDGYLELNNLKYLPNNHEDVLKYDLQTNDLLFNRTNSYELVGKTSVITEDVSERFTFASYLIRVRLFYKDFLASYVSHYINSHVGRKILLSMVTQQVGQANINSQKLASLPIPLPSQEEVMEITSWLNNYRELESKQKEMILVEENTEALKQSILSKAFRGELGTNDLGEESAIELLKDVLQEQVK